MTVRVGMLGYGFMGKAHTNAFRSIPLIWPELPAVSIRRIAGRNEERLHEAATRYGAQSCTTDWHEAATADDIDVFVNVASDAAHVAPCEAALAAGKAVVCEKPLATSYSDAKRLADAAEQAGVLNAVAFNYRFMPAVRKAREIIESGELGDIFGGHFYYAQEWRNSIGPLPTSAGAVNVIGCHAVDQARMLMGEIESVSAVFANPLPRSDGSEPIDAFDSVVTFASGAIGTIGASLIATGRKNRLGWEINGSRGSLAWDLENLNRLSHYDQAHSRGFADVIVCGDEGVLSAPWWPSGHVLGWEHGHINLWAHVLDRLASDAGVGPEAATFADGAAASRIADAMALSVEQRRVVDVAEIG